MDRGKSADPSADSHRSLCVHEPGESCPDGGGRNVFPTCGVDAVFSNAIRTTRSSFVVPRVAGLGDATKFEDEPPGASLQLSI
jgi:hypothetical protein